MIYCRVSHHLCVSGKPWGSWGLVPASFLHDLSCSLSCHPSACSRGSAVFVSWQSPGQYYFKPMMKEFRFEPSSQMIEVQEGQNLKITITGYRTAYRWAAPLLSPPAWAVGSLTHSFLSEPVPVFRLILSGRQEP